MTTAVVVLLVIVALLIGALLGARTLAKRAPKARPCYRCGTTATASFMGVHYCSICQIVVARMLPAVRHDPPYGFPGSPGYLEFPVKDEAKKEG